MHLALQDRLFGASGAWNLKRCTNHDCRLMWLDPMPLATEIGKAYRSYYTHDDTPRPVAAEAENVGRLRRAYRLVKEGYLANRYGYGNGGGGAPRTLGILLYLLPWRRVQVDLEVRSLGAVPGGRLLDLGCGSGLWLAGMRRLGWQVEGIDFDPAAATAAATRGLHVRCGSLEQQRFADATFNAITMSHVVEHLPNPVKTLTECARILKPGGRLILWTPNTASLGHHLLKQYWRGLEPPRHLHLFSPASVRALLEKAGFPRISVRSRNSRFIWEQSYRLWRNRSGVQQCGAAQSARSPAPPVLALLESVCLPVFRNAGEWLDVHATRET